MVQFPTKEYVKIEILSQTGRRKVVKAALCEVCACVFTYIQLFQILSWFSLVVQVTRKKYIWYPDTFYYSLESAQSFPSLKWDFIISGTRLWFQKCS